MSLFRKRPVLVLGAGPTGLLAAQTAREEGRDVMVASLPGRESGILKSELWGCQYLHAPALGYTSGPGHPVRYTLQGGDAEAYRRKVYGDNWRGAVSPDEYGPEEDHMAWDLRQAYDRMWYQWDRLIIPVRATENTVAAMLQDRFHVICSIPAPLVCKDEGHKFSDRGIWAMGEAPGVLLPFRPPPFTVQCNAAGSPRWYRAANVFGFSTVEWPDGPRPPIEGVVRVKKPLSTDCDCWNGDRFTRVGRFGLWRKGVLVHHVIDQVRKAL